MLPRFAILTMAILLSACQDNSSPPENVAAKSEASTPDLFFKKNQAEWNSLLQFVSQNPQDINLWERAPLKHALRLLLGSQLDIFKQYMAKSGPVLQDKVLYILGSMQDETQGQAYLLIDIENRKLEVGLIHDGKLEVFSTPGEGIYLPEDLKPLLEKLHIQM
ncbi:hypothetical protein [Iodobacter ciconiae]|uniref:Lipoprotein n=1 Tax=Iodobacter ciconiae TaxID=2496266 RepID=A0A3S8ZPK0_9NEIS|nr:hypothetical protein [Iodobacter ciconiae]AZN35394.1 hypothetical protein EJO50_02165 [Iodobacter ciconiae]